MIVDVIGVVARFLNVAGACLLTGIFAFAVLVVPCAARAAGPAAGDLFDALHRRLLRLAPVTLAIVIGSGVVDLGRQAIVATHGDVAAALSWPTLGALLSETRYGDVWLVRQLLAVLMATLLLLRERESSSGDRLALGLAALLLAGAGLAASAAAGHAASAPESTVLAIAVDSVHLVAAGVWAGALLPLFLLLKLARDGADEALPRAIGLGVRRFSALALVSVLAIFASGVYAIPQQVGSVPALLGTSYGHWLMVKLTLLLPLFAIAGVNRAYLRRLLADGGVALVARLSRSVLLETVLVAAVIGAVATLGLTTPARHDPVIWPLPFRLDWETTRDVPDAWRRLVLGGVLAGGGLLVAVAAAVVRRRWWSAALAGAALAVGLGLTVALPPFTVYAYATTYTRPTVPYTAASIVRGHRVYGERCAGCHGAGGDGRAAGTSPKPPDLTGKRTADRTVGDLFWWVTHSGTADGRAVLSHEHRWDVVNFLRTLSGAAAARRLTPTVSAAGTIVGPDVIYTSGTASERLLRDFRGRAVVLLVFFRLPESHERLLQLAKTHFDIRVLGAEILAVPLDEADTVYHRLAPHPVLFPFAIGGAEDATAAYRFFAQSPADQAGTGNPVLPQHMEVLIDVQGYLRARWIPAGPPTAREGWGDRVVLLKELSRLAGEPRSAPILGEHIH